MKRMSGQREDVCFLAPDCSGARRVKLLAVDTFFALGCDVEVPRVANAEFDTFASEVLLGNRAVAGLDLCCVFVFFSVCDFQLVRLILAGGMKRIGCSS